MKVVQSAEALHFQTDQACLDTIVQWARRIPEVDRVWIFGSRAAGLRREKNDAAAIPDLDIGYSLRGSDAGSLFGLAFVGKKEWSAWLQDRIPIPIQLEYADPQDEIVWPAIQAHGVLIYAADD